MTPPANTGSRHRQGRQLALPLPEESEQDVSPASGPGAAGHVAMTTPDPTSGSQRPERIEGGWKLDARTREVGREGIARARAILDGRATPAERHRPGSRRPRAA